MSKAFTSEESDGVAAANRPPPTGERRPITPRGYAEHRPKPQPRGDPLDMRRETFAGNLSPHRLRLR